MRVLVVDDDEVSREVLGVLLEAEGYVVETAASGADALAIVTGAAGAPDLLLTDMQMPGMSGHELALAVRAVCGDRMVVLGMSGNAIEAKEDFDGCLRKPFAMEELKAVLAGCERSHPAEITDGVLDHTVYAKLAAKMRGDQLAELYEMCLRDVEQRTGRMREAAARDDKAAFRREAHAIKGGCGMVGAVELQRLATSLEENDFYGDDVASLDEIVTACKQLRRMLIAHQSSQSFTVATQGEDAR